MQRPFNKAHAIDLRDRALEHALHMEERANSNAHKGTPREAAVREWANRSMEAAAYYDTFC